MICVHTFFLMLFPVQSQSCGATHTGFRFPVMASELRPISGANGLAVGQFFEIAGNLVELSITRLDQPSLPPEGTCCKAERRLQCRKDCVNNANAIRSGESHRGQIQIQ